jgi:hypothetical protein
MRKISRHLAVVLAGGVAAAGPALAQTESQGAPPTVIVPSQSSVYNQNSVYLPTPPTVHGQDIVRGADGSSCQSAVASSGPFLDVGLIGSQDVFDRSTTALYGRVVVPLGKRRKRVDCARLYDLEIERMRMELAMLRMGTMMATNDPGAGFGTPVGMATPDMPPEDDEAAAIVVGEPASFEPAAAPPTQLTAAPAPERADSGYAFTPASATVPATAVDILDLLPPLVLTEAGRGGAGDHFAQLGAFSTTDRARRRLQAVTAWGMASDRSAELRPLRRGDRIIYRLLLGPMQLVEAQALCSEVGNECAIVTE